MAHQSENSQKLALKTKVLYSLEGIETYIGTQDDVYFFRFPEGRTNQDAKNIESFLEKLSNFIQKLHSDVTICFFCNVCDAVKIQLTFESLLKFQLWIAVKTALIQSNSCSLPNQHTALLVFTKNRKPLRHTKTRIAYTYCPSCGKTSKDYGGKKHVYHEYGTLMSDVWRDIEIDPSSNMTLVVNRLRDIFGIADYKSLCFVDLSKNLDLLPKKDKKVKHQLAIFNYTISKVKNEQNLINGDCIGELRKIPSNSIDFCFTDPPYNLEKKYDGYNDALELKEYFAWCDLWLTELTRILKPGRTLAILNIPLWAIRHFKLLNEIMNYQNWIVWDALGFPVRLIMPSHYSILCFSKGEPRPLPGFTQESPSELEKKSLRPLGENYCLRTSCIKKREKLKINDVGNMSDLWFDIHRLKHNSRRVDHPTQLPPLLMRRLISLFTHKGEVVLDCFNGSGTTTLIAQQLQRRYVGIEISERYHNLAVKRHEELSVGIDPFAKKSSVPIAKNSKVPRLLKQEYKVSKKMLQLEVKRIAQLLSRLPTREEVKQMSKYAIHFYDEYFISWGEVCAAARTTGMTEFPREKMPIDMQPNLFSK